VPGRAGEEISASLFAQETLPKGRTIRAEDASALPESVESGASWAMAWLALVVLSISYGAPLIVVVGLQPIATALSTDRSMLALAGSLAWLGTGLGGILMGWLADRVGLRRIVLFGAAMLAAGLVVSARGGVFFLLLGHGLLIGFLGSGALFPPLLIYVSRLFGRRRGVAVALVSSGQYLAGVLWPVVFEEGLAHFGWQATMFGYAALALSAIVPMALFLRPLPHPPALTAVAAGAASRRRTLAMPANGIQAILCIAGFCCCVPMAIPAGHLVALCGDLGISAADGAAMLSLLLGAALLSRQLWGALADRIGGLRTVLAASACQAATITAFIFTRNESGLFTVAALFGLGFSGIIPGYVVAIRQLFPSREASWRLPILLLFSTCGMAFGNWFAGALYDGFGDYAPAFTAGALFNLANLLIVGFLVNRARQEAKLRLTAATRL
jgi:MFS family permease